MIWIESRMGIDVVILIILLLGNDYNYGPGSDFFGIKSY